CDRPRGLSGPLDGDPAEPPRRRAAVAPDQVPPADGAPLLQEAQRQPIRRVYGQRGQVESVFSRNQRLLGAALRARSEPSREREGLLRVLTHNLMLLAAVEN